METQKEIQNQDDINMREHKREHEHEHKDEHEHKHNSRSRRRWGHRHGEGAISIDYYAYASKIRSWNPSFKVLLAVFLIVFSMALDSMYVSAIIIGAMLWITVVLGGLSLRSYLNLMTVPLVFIIMSSIAIAVNFSGSPQGDYCVRIWFFYIYATAEGLYRTTLIVVKALGAISCMYMMSLSTPSTEIISVLRKAKVPALITELMNMIYRYIFILMEVQSKMTISAKSRLGYHSTKASIYSFGNSLSNLLVVSMRKANAYYDALESRCYDGQLNFLEEEKPVSGIHIVAAMAFIAGLTAVWLLSK